MSVEVMNEETARKKNSKNQSRKLLRSYLIYVALPLRTFPPVRAIRPFFFCSPKLYPRCSPNLSLVPRGSTPPFCFDYVWTSTEPFLPLCFHLRPSSITPRFLPSTLFLFSARTLLAFRIHAPLPRVAPTHLDSFFPFGAVYRVR